MGLVATVMNSTVLEHVPDSMVKVNMKPCLFSHISFTNFLPWSIIVFKLQKKKKKEEEEEEKENLHDTLKVAWWSTLIANWMCP